LIKALKFVRGAVSRKDYQPALSHFLIKDGQVMGYDGTIALSSPIPLDIQATPKAIPFVKAIERCTDPTTALNLTATGKISLKSGKFKATIECTEESLVLESIQPEGDYVDLSSTLVSALRTLEPFIGVDASRPWSSGILLHNFSAFATNNIILAEAWIGGSLPNINLPGSAIKELTRIAEEPIGIQLSKTSVTFHFKGDRWLRSQLLNTEWPDIHSLLEQTFDTSTMSPLPSNFFEAVETIAYAVEDDGRIYFRDSYITTALEGGIGASVEIQGLPAFGSYHHKMLMLLKDRVQQIDFTKHPNPCPFIGDQLRGVFLGMRDD